MKQPKVGVVVVTFNAQKYLGECLRSLIANTYPLEVVVVDNGSIDQTVLLVKRDFPQVGLIENKTNLGFAKGANLGLTYFFRQKFKYYLLLNDDTVVRPDLVQKLVEPLIDNPQIGLTGPIITYYQQPTKVWFAGGYFNRLFGYARHPYLNADLTQISFDRREVDFVSGCCLMAKGEVFAQAGFLDEIYENYFEDVFFCLRAKSFGFRSLLVAEPLVRHRISSSAGQEGSNRLSPFRAYYFARNPLIYVAKEAGWWLKPTLLFGQLAIRLPVYLFGLVRSRDFTSSVAYFHGLLDGFGFWLKHSVNDKVFNSENRG